MTKFKNPLQARDAIVDNSGCFHFVSALSHVGINNEGKDPNEVTGVVVKFEGKYIKLYLHEFRRATTMEYLFNYHGFGKTPWLRFIFSMACAVGPGVYCLLTESPFDPEWSRYAIGWGWTAGIPLMWTWATYRNHTGYWV